VSKSSIKIDGMKDFTFGEMVMATNNFNSSTEVGEGGYGKVYKGVLADGTVVAIKRAQEGSLQGETEFLTEIELLSRVHHRNLVSLIGYCDEEGEQVLFLILMRIYIYIYIIWIMNQSHHWIHEEMIPLA
jgi:serine/threonine protein kinase